MENPLTSSALIIMTLMSVAAWVMALRRLRTAPRGSTAGAFQQWLVSLICAGAAAVFLARWLMAHEPWQLLTAHVEGLLLIAAFFAGTVLFIQNRPRLCGLSAFALPFLTLVLAWGICASAWTYHPFKLETLHPVWKTVHLTGVYLGTVCAGIAAIAGAMFLYVEHRLKRKQAIGTVGRLASLEALESLIIRTAGLGFALLTLGLATGLVILITERQTLAEGWWYAPKIVLATLAWLTYALLMNVRFATSFRGTRAAWLAIGGLLLLLGTYAVVTALPPGESNGSHIEPVQRSTPSDAAATPAREVM